LFFLSNVQTHIFYSFETVKSNFTKRQVMIVGFESGREFRPEPENLDPSPAWIWFKAQETGQKNSKS